MNITVFLGAPGSGKGTQAKRLVKTQNYRHFSTGDMLREAVRAETQSGLKAKDYMDRGELVPDDLMIELIEASLSELGPEINVILDGFPRTVPQAEALDRQTSTKVSLALYLALPTKVLIERLTGRRVCQGCGTPYHINTFPPKTEGVCDQCGGTVIQRSDDTEEVAVRRLAIFDTQNGALLGYYRGQNKLQQINADQSAEAVQAELIRTLQSWYK